MVVAVVVDMEGEAVVVVEVEGEEVAEQGETGRAVDGSRIYRPFSAL